MSHYWIPYTYDIDLNFFKATKRRKTCTLDICYVIFYMQPYLQYFLYFPKTHTFNIYRVILRIKKLDSFKTIKF